MGEIPLFHENGRKSVIFGVRKVPISDPKDGPLLTRPKVTKNHCFGNPQKPRKSPKTRNFPLFCTKTPIQSGGFGVKVQNVFLHGPREGVLANKFGYFRGFMAKMGYFVVLSIRGLLPKRRLKQGGILEKSTICQKYDRTRKFTPARGKIGNFHLGAYLLRSARSFLDVTAFVLEDVLTAASTRNP